MLSGLQYEADTWSSSHPPSLPSTDGGFLWEELGMLWQCLAKTIKKVKIFIFLSVHFPKEKTQP